MPEPLHPPPYATDEESLARHSRIEITTGSGPGGQHRNKTQNAVRLIHEPSGVVTTASERRSLEANRQAAFERLVEKLERLNFVPKKRRATRPGRGAIERRLTAKARTSKVKRARRSRDDD